MDAAAPLGRILTFYSYKGGTGRSMALANVAWVLASSGRRVLVIDWDLEAPGLHRYFRPFLIDDELSASDGLIDLVDNYANAAIRPVEPGDTPDPQWFLEYSDFTDYVVSVNFEHFPTGGKIDFLPAGRQNDRYALTVNSFNWQNFYDRLGGGGFFEAVKSHARQKYDYVLIDSRTGVSDTAGICSVQMPDSLVVCFTYNNQSIKGAAAVSQSAVRMRKKLDEEKLASRRVASTGQGTARLEDTPSPYRVFPIPMRVDSGESDRLAIRQTFARSAFAELVAHIPASELSEYWTGVEIPQRAFYSYEEVLATFRDDPRDPKTVLSAFVRLTRYVSDRDVADYRLSVAPADRQRLLDAFAETPVATPPKRVAEPRLETDDELLTRTADLALAALSAEEKATARRVFERLVRLGRDEEGGGYFPIRASVNDFSEAESAVIRKLADRGVLAVVSERVRSSRAGLTPVPRTTLALPDQMVALADERLLKAWKVLVDWLDADRDFLLWRQQLRGYLGDWERSNRDAGALLAGQLLAEAEHWRLSRSADLNASEAQYLTQSRSAAAAAEARAAEARVAAEMREEYRRDYAETIRDTRYTNSVPAARDSGTYVAAPAPTSKMAPLPEPRTYPWTMLLAAGAVLLLLWIAAFTLRRPAPPAQSTVPGGLGLVTDAKMQIVRAYENRTGGRIPDAIGNLSEGLRLAGGDKAVTRQLYQDRAFCYKLGGDWEKAVADLTSALSIYDGMAPAERATMLSDRGDAYFRLRDLELALADYQALAAIQPKAPTVIRDYLAATLRARGSFTTAFFLFTEVGPIDQNNSSVIPPAIRPLEKFSEYLNLRFWWHQVPAAELRYTSRDDTGLAMRVADILRSGGLVVGSPVLLNSLVPRSRRIELWFQRSKPPGSDAR